MQGERTGWRDQEISGRHRTWGVNCTAVDLDLVLVEYHLARPVAIVEYKHFRAKVELGHANYRALRDLANRAGLPFLIAFYWPDTWAFRVHPMNDNALRHFDYGGTLCTEREYVERLYRLRSLYITETLLPSLSAQLPHEGIDRESPEQLAFPGVTTSRPATSRA